MAVLNGRCLKRKHTGKFSFKADNFKRNMYEIWEHASADARAGAVALDRRRCGKGGLREHFWLRTLCEGHGLSRAVMHQIVTTVVTCCIHCTLQ